MRARGAGDRRRRAKPAAASPEGETPFPPRDSPLPKLPGDWGTPRSRLGDFFVQNRDVGQVPVPLPVVQAVADDEAVRDLETDVADGHVCFPPPLLHEERTDVQGGR